MARRRALQRLVAVAVAVVSAAAAAVDGYGDLPALHPRIRAFEPLHLDAAQLHEQHERVRRGLVDDGQVRVNFAAFGQQFALRMERNRNLFSQGLKAVSVDADGVERDIDVDLTIFYRGRCENNPDAVAHAILSNGSFDGAIHTEDEIYVIEPSRTYIKEPHAFNHVIYRRSDVDIPDELNPASPNYLKCGVQDSLIDEQDAMLLASRQSVSELKASKRRESRSRARRDMGSDRTCTLAITADHTFYDKFKGSQATDLEAFNQMVRYVDGGKLARAGPAPPCAACCREGARDKRPHRVASSAADVIYRNTEFSAGITGFSFAIKNAIVWKSASAPGYYLSDMSLDAQGVLNKFSEQNWDGVCLAHLFLYRNLPNGILGLAWLGSPAPNSGGGVCRKSALVNGVMKNLNSGITTTVNNGADIPVYVSELTFAHEVGHNYGTNHDDFYADQPPGFPQCIPGGDAGNFIMFASATSGTKPNNRQFSSCSKTAMYSVMLARSEDGNCFMPDLPDICGNRIVEGNEECDCGITDPSMTELCQSIDPCCTPNCTLKAGAECSPHANLCCSMDDLCLITTETRLCASEAPCLEESHCDGVTKNCPAQVVKPNDTVCVSEKSRVCRSGVCDRSIVELAGFVECDGGDTCVVHARGVNDSSCQVAMGIPAISSLPDLAAWGRRRYTSRRATCRNLGACATRRTRAAPSAATSAARWATSSAA